MYKREEVLKLNRIVRITKEVYEVLREEKKRQKISMAKIVCNCILKNYNKIKK